MVFTKIDLGLDAGNAYMKTSEDVRFASVVEEGERKLDTPSTAYEVEINGTTWLVGDEREGGVRFITMDKCDEEEYKVLVLTAIALSCESDKVEVNLVTGIPVDFLNSHAAKYRDALMSIGEKEVKVKGSDFMKTVIIRIADAKVVDQGSINLTDEEVEYPSMCVDFGGGTFDVSLWSLDENGTPQRDATYTAYDLGFDNVLQDYNLLLKERHEITTEWHKCRQYIDRDTLLVDGKDVNIKAYRDEILSRYVKKIHTRIKSRGMNYRLVRKINVIGGCAQTVLPYLEKEMKKATFNLVEEPQFANARSFKQIAVKVNG